MKILEMLGSGKIGETSSDPVPNIVCELSNRFIRMGHEVTVADVKAAGARKLLHPAVKVCEVAMRSPHLDKISYMPDIYYRLMYRVLGGYHFNELFYLCGLLPHIRFVSQIALKLCLYDYDIIHVQHGQHAFFLHKLFHRPYIYTNHWRYKETDKNIDSKIERMVLRGAQVAVGLGSYLQQFEPRANHVIIPNGIDTDNWQPLDRQKCRKALGIAENDFVAVFVGRVEYLKGVDTLLKAIRDSGFQSEGFRLYLVGTLGFNSKSDELTPFSRQMIDQAKGYKIIFTGFMDNLSERFRQHLSAADLFILPSRSEAQPLSALEALSMGLPVVASNVGGLGEMVTSEVGYVFEPEDSHGLMQILTHLRSHPEQLFKLKANCRRFVKENYSWDKIAQRYLDIFTVVQYQLLNRQAGSVVPRHPFS